MRPRAWVESRDGRSHVSEVSKAAQSFAKTGTTARADTFLTMRLQAPRAVVARASGSGSRPADAPRRRTRARRWDTRPYRVLFLRHDRAGDMIAFDGRDARHRAIAPDDHARRARVAGQRVDHRRRRLRRRRHRLRQETARELSADRAASASSSLRRGHRLHGHGAVGHDAAAHPRERRATIASASPAAATTRRSTSPFRPSRAPDAPHGGPARRARRARSTSTLEAMRRVGPSLDAHRDAERARADAMWGASATRRRAR